MPPDTSEIKRLLVDIETRLGPADSPDTHLQSVNVMLMRKGIYYLDLSENLKQL